MTNVLIRFASPDDAPAVANLVAQLGYDDITSDAARRRLVEILGRVDHVVYVAESNGEVTGFIHLSVIETLEHEPRGEIRVLSVDEKHRSTGIGTALVEKAEAWARQRHLPKVRVRSNIKRDRARAFYERLGYVVTKTQNVFDKTLGKL